MSASSAVTMCAVIAGPAGQLTSRWYPDPTPRSPSPVIPLVPTATGLVPGVGTESEDLDGRRAGRDGAPW
jgi:hypothetical protein